MNKLVLLFSLLLVTSSAIAEIYKCPTPGGKITYTQIPCKKGFKQVKGKWEEADKEKKVNKISLVYETSKRGEIVLLELYKNEVIFSELISRVKYNEIMTLKPPTYFRYRGVDYIKDNQVNNIFWGRDGELIPVSIDGNSLGGFFYKNKQIRATGKSAKDALNAIKLGSSLKLERHYWGKNDKKEYIYFH